MGGTEEMDLYFHALWAFYFEFVFWYSDSAEGRLRAQPVFTFKEEEESNWMCTKVKSESARQCTHVCLQNGFTIIQARTTPSL